jgi:hypothetical protein
MLGLLESKEDGLLCWRTPGEVMGILPHGGGDAWVCIEGKKKILFLFLIFNF